MITIISLFAKPKYKLAKIFIIFFFTPISKNFLLFRFESNALPWFVLIVVYDGLNSFVCLFRFQIFKLYLSKLGAGFDIYTKIRSNFFNLSFLTFPLRCTIISFVSQILLTVLSFCVFDK